MIHMLRPVTVAIAIGTMIAGCGGGTDDAQDPGLNDAAVARPDAANSGTDDPGPGPVADAGASNPDVGTPSVSYCDPAEDWPEAWEELELEVLRLANIRRSDGASCGNQGNHAPTVPLELDGSLRCAARIHSQDMAERNYFSHTNPDGDEPWDRMELAGYRWQRAGENIAAGSSTAQGVIDQWMRSDGHCANIMNPDYVHVGIGLQGDRNLWTMVFGTPR